MRNKKIYKYLIFDIHGVLLGKIYKNSKLLPGDIIARLEKMGVNVYLVTNSSSMTTDEILEKLNNVGIDIDVNRIITAGISIGKYINENFRKKNIFLIGSTVLKNTINDECSGEINWCHEGHDADLVVVARDMNLDDKKISAVKQAAQNGAILLATCRDKYFSMDGIIEEGPGGIVKKIEEAMQQQALIIGKPNPYVITNIIGIEKHMLPNTLIVGDSIEQDINLGITIGCSTVLIADEHITNKNNLSGADYICNKLESIYYLVESRICA